MTKRDYYEVLGISRNADVKEIKKAYRKIALECHPDRTNHDPVAEEKFKEASEAYEVLADNQKRQIYDNYGHRGLEGSGFHGFSNVDDIFSSFGDVFEEFFGGFGGRRSSSNRARKGRDIQEFVEIGLEDAYRGTKKEIKVERLVNCKACGGTGARDNNSIITCHACGGHGQISHRQGFFVLNTTCPQCQGQGKVIKDLCGDCRGGGRTREEKKMTVKIPKGVEDGMHLILRGEGEEGSHHGMSGDLYVTIKVDEHDRFKRQGDDLYHHFPITFPQAALGDEVEVETFDGKIRVKVPSGIETGGNVKIKGKGMPNVNSSHSGDLYIQFIVKTPSKLTHRQRELLEELKGEFSK